MSGDLYLNLKNTCHKLNNYFRDMDYVDFTAKPHLNRRAGDVKDMSIVLSMSIKLKDNQIMDAEKIASEIKQTIKRDK